LRIRFNKKPTVSEQEKNIKDQKAQIKQQYDRIKKLNGD
jgi:hypothetical protein